MQVSSILLLALAGAMVFFGQDNPPGAKPKPDPQATTRTDAPATADPEDGFLAAWLLIGNENEIALAQLAQSRSQDATVKAFAQKMIDDHRQMGQKLQKFASSVGYVAAATTPPTSPPREGEARAKERPAGENVGDPRHNAGGTADSSGRSTPDLTDEGRRAAAEGTGGSIDHVALFQELGKQCLDSSRKEIESKSGAEFDKCYVGMAVGAHMKTNDMLTVFQRHASSDLKFVLAEGQKTVQAHLQHAKELCKNLEGKAHASGGTK